MFLAYLATNTVNGKRYVGITTAKDHRSRWWSHQSLARNGSRHAFHKAIKKHGADAFVVEIIACATSWDNLCALECDLIRQYDTFSRNGYNMTAGGEGVLGIRHSVEARIAMGVVRKGRKLSAEHIAKLVALNTGRPFSAEIRQKISASKKGYRHPPEIIEKIKASNAARGYQEAIANLAKAQAARRGAHLTDEHRTKLRVANIG